MSGYNVLDLFCGAGGLSCGFERAGYNILVGIDNDAKALETFRINHKGSQTICGDITEVTYSRLNLTPLLFTSCVGMVSFGQSNQEGNQR